MVQGKVKLTAIHHKKMRYSRGISIEGSHGTEVIQSDIIFDRSPLYDELTILEEGLSRMMSGWMDWDTLEILYIH